MDCCLKVGDFKNREKNSTCVESIHILEGLKLENLHPFAGYLVYIGIERRTIEIRRLLKWDPLRLSGKNVMCLFSGLFKPKRLD